MIKSDSIFKQILPFHKCNHASILVSFLPLLAIICNIFLLLTRNYATLFVQKGKPEERNWKNCAKFPYAWNNEPFGVFFLIRRREQEKGVLSIASLNGAEREEIIICILFSFCEIAFHRELHFCFYVPKPFLEMFFCDRFRFYVLFKK